MTLHHVIVRLCTALLFGAALTACAPRAAADETARIVSPPAVDTVRSAQTSETAVLAGGCFWGLEGVFEHVRGVQRVRSGYAGGDRRRANYEAVSSGSTGNAESVEIVFDPRLISYGQILQIYFSVATDPTELNRQGPDHGTQYRGNIFVGNAEQGRIAHAYVAQLTAAHAFASPIVTRIDPLQGFVAAEDYHQNYLSLHPNQPYIVANDLPKILNLQRLFPALYTARRAS